MAERVNIICDYCDAKFTIRYEDSDLSPTICCFCGEYFEDESKVEKEKDEEEEELESDNERD
jgi:hypothetical protein